MFPSSSESSDASQPSYCGASYLQKNTELHYIAGVAAVTSGLSIIGALLIIFSYFCFKSLRTKAREILVHISVMDFGYATCNLVGIVTKVDRGYYDCIRKSCANDSGHYKPITSISDCNISFPNRMFCEVQGTVATYFTLGSIMWTIFLSVYIYILISQKGRRTKIFVVFGYFFCYLMPAGVVLWLALTHRMGFSPYESNGWCSVIFKHPIKSKDSADIYASIIGYNLWIGLTVVLVPILSISIHMYIREEVWLCVED